MTERLRRASPLLAFAGLCYLPLLATARGFVVADTKAYLYIDPDRLLSRAWSMWDPHVGMGTVTHQNIGFLWPMGPYFWAMEHLGAPDWVAQVCLLKNPAHRGMLNGYRCPRGRP